MPQKDADRQTSQQFAASTREKNLLKNKLLVKFTKRCRLCLT